MITGADKPVLKPQPHHKSQLCNGSQSPAKQELSPLGVVVIPPSERITINCQLEALIRDFNFPENYCKYHTSMTIPEVYGPGLSFSPVSRAEILAVANILPFYLTGGSLVVRQCKGTQHIPNSWYMVQDFSALCFSKSKDMFSDIRPP
ncbi:hypothetical protein DUI87_06636 [Hirundo rustica rustica]|uniref:Uncharacterized protein n=1 Tax=Hirundo rustica rustica TaxID=333673 RepID=A0A3M0KUU1_HIRRU|nr:hypothetical protein DUI87_06636 [Hirundo rustica rustica]